MRGPQPSVAHAAGAAKRRRERRLRLFLRHERLTVAMLLAESQHHAAPRGQSRARSGGWERGVLHGQVPEHPTPQVAGMDVDEVPATGSRPERLAGVRPQERVQQHPVDQIVDTAPALPILDVLSCCRAGYRRAQDLSGGHPCATLVSCATAGGTAGGSADGLILFFVFAADCGTDR